MKPAELIMALETNLGVFAAQLRGVSGALQVWRPREDHWCLLEIACHLFDEEREDFRARVASVLADPSRRPTQIDPQGWGTERRYMDQDYDAKVEAFLAEREQSLMWLRGVTDAPWDNAYEHPEYGPLSALFFLTNWVAHDYLHLRQITKVKFLYLDAHADATLQYAGEW